MLSIFGAAAAVLLLQAQPAPDPQLARDVVAAAELIRDQVPLRSGPATIIGASARGVELIVEIDPDDAVDAAYVERFRASLPGIACENSQARAFLLRGGTYTYRLRGEDGQSFTTSMTSAEASRRCPYADD